MEDVYFYGCRQWQLIVSGFLKNPSLLSTKTLPYVGRRTTCIYLSVYGVVSSHGLHRCQCLGGMWGIPNEKERVNADGLEVVREKKIP